MPIHKELLFEILDNYSDDQLNEYIRKLEYRVKEQKEVLTDIYAMVKKRNKKPPVDTGGRSGA